MSEPKNMTGRRNATEHPRCILCGKGFCDGDPYHTSKSKGGPLRYIHPRCWARVKKVKT